MSLGINAFFLMFSEAYFISVTLTAIMTLEAALVLPVWTAVPLVIFKRLFVFQNANTAIRALDVVWRLVSLHVMFQWRSYKCVVVALRTFVPFVVGSTFGLQMVSYIFVPIRLLFAFAATEQDLVFASQALLIGVVSGGPRTFATLRTVKLDKFGKIWNLKRWIFKMFKM